MNAAAWTVKQNGRYETIHWIYDLWQYTI